LERGRKNGVDKLVDVTFVTHPAHLKSHVTIFAIDVSINNGCRWNAIPIACVAILPWRSITTIS